MCLAPSADRYFENALFDLKLIEATDTELKRQFFWLMVSKTRHRTPLGEMPKDVQHNHGCDGVVR